MGPGSRVPIVILAAVAPAAMGTRTGQDWVVSGLGLLRSLRGQRRRHSYLVPRPLATLSSRDASRFARRKRTGCVEPYVQVIQEGSTRSPALPARTEHPQGAGAPMASGLPIFRKERTFSGADGRGVRRLTERPYQVNWREFKSRGCHFFMINQID